MELSHRLYLISPLSRSDFSQFHVPRATLRVPVNTIFTFAFSPLCLIPKEILSAWCLSGLEKGPHLWSLFYFCYFFQLNVFIRFHTLNCFTTLKPLNPFRTFQVYVQNNHVMKWILATKLTSSWPWALQEFLNFIFMVYVFSLMCCQIIFSNILLGIFAIIYIRDIGL